MHNRGACSVLLLVLAATAATAAVAGGLPGPATPDTVRTNLWLAEALFTDIAAEVAAELDIKPARVLLRVDGTGSGSGLFQSVAFAVLTAAGHEVFIAGDGQGLPADLTYILAFRVLGVELEYPEVGRTLGIWRSWIGRDLKVSVMVELSENASGRLLLDRKLDRRYSDRFPDGDLPAVESKLYDFTAAELRGGPWHDRLEEVVVLSTLAGLVAVYFANTSD